MPSYSGSLGKRQQQLRRMGYKATSPRRTSPSSSQVIVSQKIGCDSLTDGPSAVEGVLWDPVLMSRGRSTSLDATNKNNTPKKIRGRAVHFNHTVQAVLVPSCRDFDAATSHAIWWDREDEMQFKCAAHLFIQKYGRLTDATEEELLEQGGPPPGMPPLLSLSR